MLKELLLQKGWAGKTISRPETIGRLNPIIERLIRLNHSYDAVERTTRSAQLAAGIAAHQKIARADVGKLAETVFSCGGTAYNGTDLEPSDFDLGKSNISMLENLIELEQDFQKTLEAEKEIEHHMRTRAILSVLKKNSNDRLDFLREINKELRKP